MIVAEQASVQAAHNVGMDARVSSSEHREHGERQAERFASEVLARTPHVTLCARAPPSSLHSHLQACQPRGQRHQALSGRRSPGRGNARIGSLSCSPIGWGSGADLGARGTHIPCVVRGRRRLCGSGEGTSEWPDGVRVGRVRSSTQSAERSPVIEFPPRRHDEWTTSRDGLLCDEATCSGLYPVVFPTLLLSPRVHPDDGRSVYRSSLSAAPGSARRCEVLTEENNAQHVACVGWRACHRS